MAFTAVAAYNGRSRKGRMNFLAQRAHADRVERAAAAALLSPPRTNISSPAVGADRLGGAERADEVEATHGLLNPRRNESCLVEARGLS